MPRIGRTGGVGPADADLPRDDTSPTPAASSASVVRGPTMPPRKVGSDVEAYDLKHHGNRNIPDLSYIGIVDSKKHADGSWDVTVGSMPTSIMGPRPGQKGSISPRSPLDLSAEAQTACFRLGLALKRTVLPAFTLTGSPVRGFRALRALVFFTVKVPNEGRVKPPSFLSSRTMASIRRRTRWRT